MYLILTFVNLASINCMPEFVAVFSFEIFKAGPNAGNIHLNPGPGGTVFIGHTDMLKLFQVSKIRLSFILREMNVSTESNKYHVMENRV